MVQLGYSISFSSAQLPSAPLHRWFPREQLNRWISQLAARELGTVMAGYGSIPAVEMCGGCWELQGDLSPLRLYHLGARLF